MHSLLAYFIKRELANKLLYFHTIMSMPGKHSSHRWCWGPAVELVSCPSRTPVAVAYIGQLALRSALTTLGYNLISYLRETFEIDFARSRKQNMSILKKSNWLSDHQLNNVTMGIELHEMLDVHPCAFTRPEVYQMLDYVCTVCPILVM